MVAVWLNVPLLCQAGRALRAGSHAHSSLCPFPFYPLRSCPESPGQHGVSLKKIDNALEKQHPNSLFVDSCFKCFKERVI